MERLEELSHSQRLNASKDGRSHPEGTPVAETVNVLTTGASAVTTGEGTTAGEALEGTHLQRPVRVDDLRVTRDPDRMRRRESAARTAQGGSAKSKRSNGRAHTFSAAGEVPWRTVKSSTVPAAVLPPAAGAAVSASKAIQQPIRTRTALRRSISSAVSKADHSRLPSSRHSPLAAKRGKDRADSKVLARNFPSKGSTGSRGGTHKINKSPSRPLRRPTLAHTSSSPTRRPAAQASVRAALGHVHPSLSDGSGTPGYPAFTSVCGAMPASSSASVSNLSLMSRGTSTDALISSASSRAPLAAASSGTLSLSRSVGAASFSLCSSMLEHSLRRQNSITATKALSLLKKYLPKAPPSTPQVVRKGSTTMAAENLTEKAGRTVPALTAPRSKRIAPRSKLKNGGIKCEAEKTGGRQPALQAMPRAPRTRPALEHNASTHSESGTFASSSRSSSSISALFQTAKSRTLGYRKSFKGYQSEFASDPDTRMVAGDNSLKMRRSSGASLQGASAATASLFSTSAIYSAAAAVSSSSSVSSDASSSSVSAHAALPSSRRTTLQVSTSVPANASSSLRSILRVSAATTPSRAPEIAEREKRRRRNAHFALCGFAAASSDVASSRDVSEPPYAQPAEPPSAVGAVAVTGEIEHESMLASFEKVRMDTADGRLSLGERYPARWWSNTRERVAVTKTMVERWQKETIAQWHDEQVDELDVFISAVEAVGNRLHEVLARELQELIRPEWVIHSSDSLVRLMLRTPDEAEERARRGDRKRQEEEAAPWRGPSAHSIFVAYHIFAEAEAERERLAQRERRLRDKTEVQRARFALGAKNVLSPPTVGIGIRKSPTQGKDYRWPSRWSLPAPGLTVKEERTAARTSPPTATAAGPATSARPKEAFAVARGAAATREGRCWAPSSVNQFNESVGGGRQPGRRSCPACKDVLATEVAACLGFYPSRCPFPIEALKSHPPSGYGRAPIEEENLRIFSDLEDFLYVNRVPIQRPPGDFRRTPLLSTLKHPRGVASDEDATSATKTGDSSSDEAVHDGEAAVARPKGEQGPTPLSFISGGQASELSRCLSPEGGSLQGPTLQWSLSACSCQQPGSDSQEQESSCEGSFRKGRWHEEPLPGPPQTPFYAESVCRADKSLLENPEPRTRLMDSSVPCAEKSAELLASRRSQEQSEKKRGQVTGKAPPGWDRLVVPHLHRFTAPPTSRAPTGAKDALAARYKMDRRTLNGRIRSQSSVDPLGALTRTLSLEPKPQQHTAGARHTRGEEDTHTLWKAQAYCERIKHKAGKKLLKQEDVKVSEFWKLRFKEDGTSVWSYEGLQCEPITVSSMRSASVYSVRSDVG